MGFFSSIGSVLGGAVGSIFGPVGSVIGAGFGNAAGSALGGSSSSDKRYNQQMAFAQSQDQFSRDYVQNAIQWRVADAKKAGVHPMAALGISTPQYSAASLPSIPSDTQSIDPMEFGQSLNYAATKAKDRKQQAQMVDLQMRGLELDNEFKQAQIDALKVDTLASSIASNQAWQSPANPTLNANDPFSSGSPYLDTPIVRDGWILDEKGRKVGIVPSDDAAQRFEDKFVLEWIPFAGSAVRSFKGKYLGQEVNGHWWHGEDKGFLPYPPKRSKGYFDHVSDVLDFYRDSAR